jgi:hypothetical protein
MRAQIDSLHLCAIIITTDDGCGSDCDCDLEILPILHANAHALFSLSSAELALNIMFAQIIFTTDAG